MTFHGIDNPRLTTIRFRVLSMLCLALLFVAACSKSGGKNPAEPNPPGGPAGSRLLISDNYDLYIHDLTNHATTGVTADSFRIEDYNSQFSPDGQHAIWQRYFGNSIPGRANEVWTMDGTGAGPRLLASGNTGAYIWQYGAISSANKILYASSGRIHIVDFAGTSSDSISVPEPSFSSVQWSPQGDRIAFIGGAGTYPGPDTAHVYVVNADGTGQVQLAAVVDPTATNVLRWSPDGSKLAIVRATSTSYSAPLKLSVMEVATRTETYLADARQVVGGHFPILVAWAKDGSRLYFTNYADSHLYSISITGGSVADVSQAVAGGPSLSSDGSSLAYTQGASVVVSNLDGSSKWVVYTSPAGHTPEVGAFH